MGRYFRKARERLRRGKARKPAAAGAFALLAVILLRLLSGGSAAALYERMIRKIAADEKFAGAVVAFELGIPYRSGMFSSKPPEKPDEKSTAETALPERAAGVFYEARLPDTASEASGTVAEPEPEHASGSPLYADASKIRIYNSTDFEPDTASLLERKPELSLDPAGPQILIIHTHSSEAYTGDYEPSDYYRTEDREQNVIHVGDEMEAAFKDLGMKVIHDRNIYDYPSYTGSYARTLGAVQRYLEKYGCIGVVIDLHRDAVENADGTQYRTDAKTERTNAAQLMFVIGTGQSGLQHPDWEKNLTLAVHLQAAIVYRYPGLCRPIALTKERYNQHLSPGYFILEVGSAGNTLEEAVNAARLFAECTAPVFKEYMALQPLSSVISEKEGQQGASTHFSH